MLSVVTEASGAGDVEGVEAGQTGEVGSDEAMVGELEEEGGGEITLGEEPADDCGETEPGDGEDEGEEEVGDSGDPETASCCRREMDSLMMGPGSPKVQATVWMKWTKMSINSDAFCSPEKIDGDGTGNGTNGENVGGDDDGGEEGDFEK